MSVKKQPVKKNANPIIKPAQKETKEKAPSLSFFEKSGIKTWYLFIGILCLISFLVFKDFLLFNRLFLFKDIGSDSLNGYYPSIMATSHYLREYGNLSWSFNIGMGQDGTPLGFYDGLNALLYLFPPSKMAWLLGYAEVIKIILGGIVFYAFLRTLGNSTFSALTIALMFAFSGYMIVGGEWYGFSFEALETALVLLGFELLFKKNIPWVLPIPIFLIGISNPYNLFPLTIFLTIYVIFRYFQENMKGIRGLLILFLKIAGISVIGVAISAPIMVDHLKAMLESARVSGTNSYFVTLSSAPIFSLVDPVQLGTCIHRFFSSEMLGTADKFQGFGNYLEAPLFYCGIPCLLLTPLLFGYLPNREKKIFGILLGVWLLPILFPFLRHAFWLFSGDYYRTYSLYVALIFLIFSAACLDKIAMQKSINVILLASVATGLILIQLFPYFGDHNVLNAQIDSGTKIYVLLYTAILFWISRQNSDIPKYIFLIVLVSELTWFSSISVNRTANPRATEWNDKLGYNDYSVDAISYIKSHDKSFYRIDKMIGSSPAERQSLNDAMVQDYYGTSCYNSFNQKYYLQYLLANNVINPNNESESRWSSGLIGRPLLESLNSVKYILSKDHLPPSSRPGIDSIASMGDVNIYKNNLALPIGFCYSKYIKFSDFKKASSAEKGFIDLEAAVISDSNTNVLNQMQQFNIKDTMNPQRFTMLMYIADINNLKQDTIHTTLFSPTHIIGEIDLKASKLLYYSIPYDLGWHLKVDGKPQSIILIANGMIGVVLNKGHHQVELSYEPPYQKTGKGLAWAGIIIYGGMMFAFNRKRRKSLVNS